MHVAESHFVAIDEITTELMYVRSEQEQVKPRC